MIEEGVMLECVFVAGAVVVSFLVSKIGKFPVLCKYQIQQSCSELQLSWTLCGHQWFFHHLVSTLMLCGGGGYICMLTEMPLVHVGSLVALLNCALAISILNAATVELYPTKSR